MLMSDRGNHRMQEMHSARIPQETLYAIDKIVRMKLKEEDFKLNHIPTPSDSEAIPEEGAETDDIPIKTETEGE